MDCCVQNGRTQQSKNSLSISYTIPKKGPLCVPLQWPLSVACGMKMSNGANNTCLTLELCSLSPPRYVLMVVRVVAVAAWLTQTRSRSYYVDGVSLTRGNLRQHVWTYSIQLDWRKITPLVMEHLSLSDWQSTGSQCSECLDSLIIIVIYYLSFCVHMIT